MDNIIPKKKLGRTDLMVSRIGLGTVEMGFPYGIGPRSALSEKEAIEFLKSAVKIGITFIDTAHFYGTAEEAIGKSGIAKLDGVVIATKCGHVLDRAEDVSPEDLEKQVREEVEGSMQKLQLDTLPLVMYHGGSKEQIESGILVDIMQKLKNEGKVRYAGISTRGEESTLAAIRSGFFDAIQIGYSIIDQRMGQEVLREAEKNNIGIINRSVFLKGVLTPSVQYLPLELNRLKETSDKANKIAERLGIDLPALAVRFALSHDVISTSLIGSNKLTHLKEAAKAVADGPLPDSVIEELEKLAITDISLVDPAHWPPSAVSDNRDGKKIAPHFFKGSNNSK